MNKIFTIAAGALIGIAAYAAPALAGVDVSISLGQPNFYGRIDMGDAPPPRIIYAEPRIVERVTVVQEPIYLHVRPGHARNWTRYCGEYNACGQRVYFVNDNWYNTTYVQHYRQRGGGHDEGQHDDGHDGHHEGDRDHDNGHHRGHGNGDDNGQHGD
jgi:hypothetical protein